MATKKTTKTLSESPMPPMPQQPQPMQPQVQQPMQPAAPAQPMMQQPQYAQPQQPVQPQPQPYDQYAQYAQPQQPYMQQPVQPQPQQPMQPAAPAQPMMQQPQYAQPQQPVQYVMMQQSLQGVSGWLIFFLICFGLAAIGYIWSFFASMMILATATGVVGLIFSPVLAGGYITSIVMIAMRKRLGKLITLITLGISTVFTIISSIIAYAVAGDVASTIDRSYSLYGDSLSSTVSNSIPLLIAGIVVSIVIHALIALYFILSKRVKETLVN